MKTQLLSLLLPLALISGRIVAADRGNIGQTELTGMQVTKIALKNETHQILVTLEDANFPVVIPGPIPFPGPGPYVPKTRTFGGGDGPKPLGMHNLQLELDPTDASDVLTYQLLLKAYGTYSPVTISLGSNGRIAGVAHEGQPTPVVK